VRSNGQRFHSSGGNVYRKYEWVESIQRGVKSDGRERESATAN